MYRGPVTTDPAGLMDWQSKRNVVLFWKFCFSKLIQFKYLGIWYFVINILI